MAESKLRISTDLSLPGQAVTETFGVLAKRGSGKTYTAAVLAEEMLKAGHQVVVIDPLDAWFGLRSSADGKHEGLPIVVVGGEHGDIPLEASSGKVLADAVVEQRLSCVLSLRHLSKNDQRKFVTDFLERLYHRKGEDQYRQPLHLIIDEADAFVPQRIFSGQERMVGAVDDIVRRGRSSGLGVTLITQRAAVINKDVLTQIETLIVLRTISPQDRKAMETWIEAHDAHGQRQEFMESLASLPIGTAWIWSPGWLEIFQRVKIRQRETFDSSATPKIGQKAVTPTRVADVDLEELKRKMAATIEKAKAEDPRELRRRILELERQAKKGSAPLAPPEKVIERIEVPVLRDEQREAIESYVNAVQDWGGKLISTGNEVIAALRRVGADAGRMRPPPIQRPQTPAESPVVRRQERSEPSGDFTLRKGERLMLEVLARHHPMRVTRAQLGTLSKFSPRGGTFGTYFGTLKRNGLIFEEGGEVQLTEEGMAEVGHVPASPQTADELQSMWRSALRAGEATMLDELIRIYPASIGREDLGERTGYTASGGTFGTYLGTLRRNGLIEERGREVRASDTLFLAERTSA